MEAQTVWHSDVIAERIFFLNDFEQIQKTEYGNQSGLWKLGELEQNRTEQNITLLT